MQVWQTWQWNQHASIIETAGKGCRDWLHPALLLALWLVGEKSLSCNFSLCWTSLQNFFWIISCSPVLYYKIQVWFWFHPVFLYNNCWREGRGKLSLSGAVLYTGHLCSLIFATWIVCRASFLSLFWLICWFQAKIVLVFSVSLKTFKLVRGSAVFETALMQFLPSSRWRIFVNFNSVGSISVYLF